MRFHAGWLVIALALTLPPMVAAESTPGLRFTVELPTTLGSATVDGRLLVMLSTDPSDEPRFQIGDRHETQQVFGVDVDGVPVGSEVVVDATAFGYPVRSLAEISAGEYRVQALLHRYETFHRADGHVVRLPMDRGEGQQWNRAPGNRYSTPRTVALDPAADVVIRIALDREIPPIEPPEDTEYVKHVRIRSELLSEFWGRDFYLGAHVLLPLGFDEHPEARYPLAIMHGHFPHDFDDFRTTAPDPELEQPDWDWIETHCPNGHHPQCDEHGYDRVMQQAAYDFYRVWTGPDFPRVLAVYIQHPTPYYDDSYAVNSANMGPYGDAITYELIPHIEQRFRGLGPWARVLYGGSTGGWETLAAQIFYPDEYNGAYGACPDPVDFRAYTVVDIYEHDNAYFEEGPWRRVARPGQRDYLGQIANTLEQVNHLELALASKGRSGQQWDAWQAVYSPVGEDGYPAPIWDKLTGEIDPEVAAHWRENYDLRYILERDWAELGPKLRGKLHVYCGDMDNFYLNNAVYLLEEFLDNATDPPADAEVDYGDRHEHCWNGDHEHINAISRLQYHQRFIPRAVEHWLATAPDGADTTSWRY
jgi:hypothetical protein